MGFMPTQDDPEVRAAIETIRSALMDIRRHAYPLEPGVLTDAVVVYAVRTFDERGGQTRVTVMPLDELQANYTTQGLLYHATDLVAAQEEDEPEE